MAEFCTSIAIMEEGRVLASGRVSDILARLQPAMKLEIEPFGSTEVLAKWLGNRQSVEQVQAGDRIVQCRWTPEKSSRSCTASSYRKAST